jgi:hypothetical protein
LDLGAPCRRCRRRFGPGRPGRQRGAQEQEKPSLSVAHRASVSRVRSFFPPE